MVMKITHFITDEKFIDNTIHMFEGIAELENRYVIIHDSGEPFQLLTSPLVEKIDTDEVRRIISTPSLQDVIVIHNLLSLPCEYIKQIDHDISVVWLSWGFDIYNNTYPQFPLVKLKSTIKPKSYPLRYRLRKIHIQYRYFRKKLLHPQREKRQDFIDAIHRVDYFSGVIPAEYDFMRQQPFFRAQGIAYNYPSRKEMYTQEEVSNFVRDESSPCIQVGHNGTDWGNHIDTFYRLKKIQLDGKKIIAPLNYGGNPLYREIVIRKGKELFGDQFMPLTTFLPVTEYFAMIKSITVAIYNFERQAAFGNIKFNLWNGTKVFLPEDSINYRFLLDNGIKVFSIERQLTQEEIDTPLTVDEVLSNREIISKYSSFNAVQERARKSFLFIQSQR